MREIHAEDYTGCERSSGVFWVMIRKRVSDDDNDGDDDYGVGYDWKGEKEWKMEEGEGR